MLTFKNSNVINKSKSRTLNIIKETSLIYLVAAVGCGLNILFLDLFTDVFHLNQMIAKILTTGIMLFGNYLARKMGIYREAKTPIDASTDEIS